MKPMNRGIRILKGIIRSAVSAGLLAAVVLGIFLGGYFAGWWSAPAPGRIEGDAVVAPVEEGEARPAERVEAIERSADREHLPSRLSRLAAWLAPNRHKRSSHTRVIAEIGGMLPDETRQGIEQLERAPDSTVVAELRSLLLLRWATLEAKAAFAYWRANSERVSWPKGMASDLLIRWAAQDPKAALEGWRAIAAQLTDIDSGAGYALRQIFSNLARRDFTLALAEANRVNGDDKMEALRGLASLAVNESHRSALLQTLAGLPAGKERSTALREALGMWFSSGDRTGPIAWLDSAGLEPVEHSKVQDEIARRWFMDNRQAAADWLVARAQTPAERAHALEQIMFQWTPDDPIAAGHWLSTQGLDSDSSRAMQVYAEKLAANFPAEAVTWARSIPLADAREMALARVAKRLRELHPTRAAELLGDR